MTAEPFLQNGGCHCRALRYTIVRHPLWGICVPLHGLPILVGCRVRDSRGRAVGGVHPRGLAPAGSTYSRERQGEQSLDLPRMRRLDLRRPGAGRDDPG